MIQVSDRVKQTEQQRLGLAQAAHQGFNYHMAGGRLVNGALPADGPAVPVPAPAPVPAAAPAQQQYVPAVPQFNPLAAFVPHQHIFLHQPHMYHQAHFGFALLGQQANFAPPHPQQHPANPVPAQVPQVGVVPLQPPQGQQQYFARHDFAQRNINFPQQNPPNQNQ